jgi:hypothetical protein
MKKTILTKMVMLAGLVLLGFTGYGQDEQDTSWNHWYPDSTYVPEPQPVIVENTLNAVVRLETKAMVRLQFTKLKDEVNIAIYDNESFTYHEDFQRSGEYIQFASIPLDKSYSVVQYLSDGTSMVVANIDTRNKKGQPIEVSDALAHSLENWVVMETSEQPRALTHIAGDNSLDHMERLYYIQRFYDVDQHFGDDLVGTDPPEFGDDDILLNEERIPKFEEYLHEEEDDEEDCKCNYVLKLTREIYPGIRDEPNRRMLYNYDNKGKWYYGKGSNIWSRLEEWNNGPAKQHILITENTKMKGPNRDATRGNLIDQTSASNNKSQLYWHLVCDKTASGKAVPENCLCEKELTISYQYDTRLIANAQSINCGLLCGDKGAAATAEDWASIILTRYKLNKENEVLESSRAIVKASCDDVGPLNTVAQVADFGAKMAEALFPFAGKITLTKDKGLWVVKPEFTINLDIADQIKKLAAAVESGTKIFQTPDGTCTIVDKDPLLFKETRIVSLKANEPLALTMYSAHQLSAGAKRSGRGEAKVISGYYMSGSLTSNKTQTELDYCCMKKIGTYNSGASADSPEPIEAYQDFMGVEFGKVGPWDAPYNTRNPRTWNSSDVYVPFQVDYLTGNSGCDDVIIQTRVAREKSEYLHEFSARFDENVGLAIQGNTQNRELSYIVYDIMGKTIAQGITSESSISISASTISGLRKGTYLITLRELNTNNPPHTIRINKL